MDHKCLRSAVSQKHSLVLLAVLSVGHTEYHTAQICLIILPLFLQMAAHKASVTITHPRCCGGHTATHLRSGAAVTAELHVLSLNSVTTEIFYKYKPHIILPHSTFMSLLCIS